jgi:F0F1-type ATP synthase membrane subunit c/vacuolar-type H+-ATPase subunit K
MTLPWSDPTQTLDESEKLSIERQWLTIRILWGSLMVALAVYVIIAHVIGPEGAVGIDQEPGDPEWLAHAPRYVLGVISVGVLATAFFIRRAASNPKSRISRTMGAYLPMIVVSSALCESVGIYGLVIFMLERHLLWLYIFVGVAAASMILLRPRKRDLINLAVRSKSQRDP